LFSLDDEAFTPIEIQTRRSSAMIRRIAYFLLSLAAVVAVPYAALQLFGTGLAVGAIRGTSAEKIRGPELASEQWLWMAVLVVSIILAVLFFRAGVRAKR
jgi:hypothetical protein